MIKSMTGFGKATGGREGKKLCVEIRTLNSKQLDINTKIYRLYKEKESEIRSILAKNMERGRIDVSVYFENEEDTSNYTINKNLLIKYFEELKSISAEAKNDFPTDHFALALRMPDVFTTGSEELSEDNWQQFLNVLDDALKQVNKFRLHEGEILEKDITERIKLVLQLLKEVTPYEKMRIEIIKKRIQKDIDELIGKGKTDKNRFEEELIYYMEKIDITEEKVRLKKHCGYFLETIKQPEANGRKLGFISQEIGREINTLGSKANDADIQKIVVQMKDELEKIKEQLLNIL
ncbi:MAG: YicC/YloC family endoribonuclease [Bacteroidales bacterium]